MTTTRRLAAILAADVAGYSAAMERDEEGTATAVRVLRREVIEPKLQEHHGRLIKTTGDGFLAEFASPIAALNCALAIQQRADESSGLRLRIGLNLGDVIIEEGGDLLGEGVNIAARLEGLAEPGGILVSDKIVREVEGKVEASFEDRGDQQVKNISKPVRAYAVRKGAPAAAIIEIGKPLSLPDKPSIAVLPFQNMSGDPDQEYFADGMVEDIITALSCKKGLFVIARNSSFVYKGRAVDIKKVGQELGVRYVLEGSVRKSGSRVRITGQLIDAVTGAHIWADRFDGHLDDVFDLQDKVTTSVIAAIAPEIEKAEIARSVRKPTNDLNAYDFYLRGIAATHAMPITQASSIEARKNFKKAITLDPHFALGWACFAGSHSRLFVNRWHLEEVDFVGRALSAAERALSLDRDDPQVLGRCGWIVSSLGRRPQEALDLLEDAVKSDPNYAMAWVWNGATNGHLGYHTTAIERITHAMRLSPRDALRNVMFATRANSHFYSGAYQQALQDAEQVQRLEPAQVSSHHVIVASHALLGELNLARTALAQFLQLHPQATLKSTLEVTSYRRPDDVDRLATGLRLAGYPE